MKTTRMTKMVEAQTWKVGDSVLAKDTDFDITKDKSYKILARGKFHDCLVIINDADVEEEYSQEYFDLIVE